MQIAGSDIKKGEVLVSVPRKAWIKPDDLDGTIAAKLTGGFEDRSERVSC